MFYRGSSERLMSRRRSFGSQLPGENMLIMCLGTKRCKLSWPTNDARLAEFKLKVEELVIQKNYIVCNWYTFRCMVEENYSTCVSLGFQCALILISPGTTKTVLIGTIQSDSGGHKTFCKFF